MANQTAPSETARRSRGRPRDEDAERRMLAAALDIYGERGWYGLTANEVIRRAAVGKATFYGRWSTVGELLYEAFSSVLRPMEVEDVEVAGLRDVMLVQGRLMAGLYLGPARVAFIRAMAESEVGPPAMSRIRDQLFMRVVEHTRSSVRAAIEHDGIPAGWAATDLLEMLEGAVFMHFTSGLDSAPRQWPPVHADGFVELLVDRILTAMHATPSTARQPSRR